MGNNLAIGIPIIAIFLLINGGIIISKSVNSREALDALQAELEKLRTLADQLRKVQLRMAESLRKDPAYTGSSLQELVGLEKEYREVRSKVDQQRIALKRADQNARNALHGHVMAQNLVGGGANDLSAILYYGKSDRYNRLCGTVPTITDDVMLVVRVMQYIEYFTVYGQPVQSRRGIAAAPASLPGPATAVPAPGQKAMTGAAPVKQQATQRFAAANIQDGQKEAKKEKQVSFKKEAMLGAALAGIILAVYFNWGTITQKAMSLMGNQAGTGNFQTAALHTQPVPAGENAWQPDNQGAAAKETEQNAFHPVTANEENGQIWYTVSTSDASRLHVRTAPQNGEIISSLDNGTKCQGTGNASDDGKWIEINLPDGTGTGWVFRDYLISQDAV